MKVTSSFELNPGAIDLILHGPQSLAQKRAQAHKIEARWQANVHNLTGATDASIGIETEGTDVFVKADAAANPQSAWFFLEYGTSSMRAQHPARRAIRGG